MQILQLLATSPETAVAFLLAIVVAITVHEFAHAWTAVQLGDDTPEYQGRVTLSPLAHLDPVGSVLFLITGFGWGRPVQYNPNNLRRHSDEVLVALAGPVSNLLLAIVFNVLATIIANVSPGANSDIFRLAALINVSLAAFNMVPIPPLDGSAIIAYFVPSYRALVQSQIGTVILLLLIFVPLAGGNLLGVITRPILMVFSYLTTLGGLIG